MSMKFLLAAICGAALFDLAAGPSQAAKQPPNCAAIAFRPLLSRTSDGKQDAGLYKSRFGRIEVEAQVKDGVAQSYFVEINGKALAAAHVPLPDSIAACARAKRLAAPTTPEPACTGDQLTVLIDHSGVDRYVLLYAHRAGAWHFCSAGIA